MGKKDTTTKHYMRNPVIFADAFNQYLYHGRQVIKPENLRELDSTELAILYDQTKKVITEQKYRDVLKIFMTDNYNNYCILGIENQSDIHYAMPVKNMVYDALQFAHQVSETAKQHKNNSTGTHSKDITSEQIDSTYKPTGNEYLSGFWRTDRLVPIITLVIFFGADAWDVPLSLKEMFAETNETIMAYVPDYKVNLIAPNHMSDDELDEFHSSLKEVLSYIKYSNDVARLDEITTTNKRFQSLDREAADVLNIVTNSKLVYPTGEETINMCTAIQKMREASKLEGRIEGAILTYRRLGCSIEQALKNIIEDYDIDNQEATRYIETCWK